MLRLFTKLVGSLFALRAKARVMDYQPYPDAATNTSYNLLFCDDLARAKAAHTGAVAGPWEILFAPSPDRGELKALAADSSQDARVRLLAYHALGKRREASQRKELLGMVVEVGLRAGLETLAAYQDGQAKYIGKSGQMIEWACASPDPQISAGIQKLFLAGQAVVAKTGPWDKSRLIPPPEGVVRISLLVSNGLYFGHGPIAVLQRDPIGGPVIAAATELMTALTGNSVVGDASKASQ